MATFSGLRDRQYSHDTRFKNNSVASTALRQVIGFNPSGKGFPTLDSVVSTTFRGAPQRKVSACGPNSPRSALQDLLAVANEGVSSSSGKPEKLNEVKSVAVQQAGRATDSQEPQSLDSKRIDETQVATGLDQASLSLHRTTAIGFAAVLVESSDDAESFFRNLRISDTGCYRQQHASTSKGCRQKQHGTNSLFIRLGASPTTSDHSNDLAFSVDFLSSCYLCRRRLAQGRDIFMYNGDKAFCSEECRYRQIVMDERKDKGPPTVIRSGSVTGAAHHTAHLQPHCKNHTVAAA